MRNLAAMIVLSVLMCYHASARRIIADPSNYKSFVSGLLAGDTLSLSAGIYTNQLSLNQLHGTSGSPIVIMGRGNTTVFLANACCNTIDMTDCSYLIIKNLKIDGQHINYVDGVKASGGGNRAAHHITLENLLIVNNGGSIDGDNQTVGISTKCAAWNWTIRNCTIIAAGTGLYLGNSDGSCPFVSGIIENNLVINTRGYNMQVKAQNNNTRSIFPETSNDSQHTIIRYNVFSKDSGSTPMGVGDGSRPCLLMDNFPSSGFGANDTYEVYGNFFYNNPTEALMQITGNTAAYDNVLVNHVAPPGFSAIVITNHNGFQPRRMHVFHNTILSSGTGAGISLSGRDTSYPQYCYGNVIFVPGTVITGFVTANTLLNLTDTYANAGIHVTSASTNLQQLDVYPKVGHLRGLVIDKALFTNFTDYNLDFNRNTYDWAYKGAYSGAGVNPGWKLQTAIRTMDGSTTHVNDAQTINEFIGSVYPNPVDNRISIDVQMDGSANVKADITDLEGNTVLLLANGRLEHGHNFLTADVTGLATGFYLLRLELPDRTVVRKIFIRR